MAAPPPPNEETVRLPPKITNQNTIRSQQGVRLLLNAYEMDVKGAVEQVYQFKLTFHGRRDPPENQPQAQQRVQELAKGPRNDESKETRRRLLWEFFNQLARANPDFFGTERRIFVYDCADTLFCVRDLGLRVDEFRDFELQVDRDALDERCRSYIRRINSVMARLQRTGTVNLRNAYNDVIRGDSTVNRFLELLTTQRLLEEGTHYIFGNKAYKTNSVIQLQGDPRILKAGMQKNVRFVGDTLHDAKPIVQIDAKKSAFFPNIDLMEYLGVFFNMQNPRQLEDQMDRIFEAANKQVKGLSVHTLHLPADRQITFVIFGLTDRSASEVRFERQGQMITVQEHFETTHQLRLRFPGLPCVIQKTPQRMSYYPLEYIRIIEGQRVPIEKQTPRLTEQMIRQCQVLPADVPIQIEAQRADAFVQNGNPFFQRHNVRCEPQLMAAEAQMLFPPSIQYNGNDRVEPERGSLNNWRTVGREVPARRQYAKAAKFPKTWAIVIVQNCVGMEECRRFAESYVATAQARGLAEAGLPPRVDHFTETNIEYCRSRFEFYSHHKCMFLMVFAPGKRDAHPGDIHHVLKKLEQQYSVLTQHISPEIMKKAAGGGGGAAMVIENLLMKTNLKLGGVNYFLVTSNAFRQASRNPTDVVADVWLGSKRMFIGIDFSHAPPQSLYQRQAGEAVAVPTVVGMAYTVGKMALKMRGTYWMQTPRQTTMDRQHVRPLIDNIKYALGVYEGECDTFPDHLIVFRAGASEGEFKRITAWEGYAFETAFAELAAQRAPQFRAPAVTIIVCQRQSNYRAVPENPNRQLKPPEQNVQPGTVVDKRVMNAALTEFLLVGHRALQGTAQPVRCTVVHEYRPPSGPAARYPRMPVEELENITFVLCYSHGNFAGSTAVPGVLYSGADLAKRGRNNWKMLTADGAQAEHFELPPRGEDGQPVAEAQQQLDARRTNYYARISDQLQPSIPTKFWA